ncbi:uncharacterized protein LOC124137762 [Haliotis rufescens]|uniref:uncharacterized protein LOC124137762 n=1 Tax=Haliotis rufescens TaxID=6454 RepID=UPI00201F4941|nr:uncharacterized protein LOC124137762 [Haliotis rufescens]
MSALQISLFVLCGSLLCVSGNSQMDDKALSESLLWSQLKQISTAPLSQPSGVLSSFVKNGEPVVGKRGFDSIGHNNHFGSSSRGMGRNTSGDDDNLVFTFESLFPAIARQLRSRGQ